MSCFKVYGGVRIVVGNIVGVLFQFGENRTRISFLRWWVKVLWGFIWNGEEVGKSILW